MSEKIPTAETFNLSTEEISKGLEIIDRSKQEDSAESGEAGSVDVSELKKLMEEIKKGNTPERAEEDPEKADVTELKAVVEAIGRGEEESDEDAREKSLSMRDVVDARRNQGEEVRDRISSREEPLRPERFGVFDEWARKNWEKISDLAASKAENFIDFTRLHTTDKWSKMIDEGVYGTHLWKKDHSIQYLKAEIAQEENRLVTKRLNDSQREKKGERIQRLKEALLEQEAEKEEYEKKLDAVRDKYSKLIEGRLSVIKAETNYESIRAGHEKIRQSVEEKERLIKKIQRDAERIEFTVEGMTFFDPRKREMKSRLKMYKAQLKQLSALHTKESAYLGKLSDRTAKIEKKLQPWLSIKEQMELKAKLEKRKSIDDLLA